MQTLLFIPLFLSTICSLAQTKDCSVPDLHYQINKYRRSDTLGDLIISPNAHLFVRNIRNVVFLNKKNSDLKLSVAGGDMCLYNDTTLLITPSSTRLIFQYILNGDTLSKEYKVNHFPRIKLVEHFDNRMLLENSDLIKYQCIDSIGFELVLPDGFEFFPSEDFIFTISSAHFYVLRNKKLVAEKKCKMATCFYIGDLFKKARPGDKLLIEFYPEWYRDGELSYMACVGLFSCRLGRRK